MVAKKEKTYAYVAAWAGNKSGNDLFCAEKSQFPKTQDYADSKSPMWKEAHSRKSAHSTWNIKVFFVLFPLPLENE